MQWYPMWGISILADFSPMGHKVSFKTVSLVQARTFYSNLFQDTVMLIIKKRKLLVALSVVLEQWPSSLVDASPRFKAQKNPRHFAILSSGPFLFFFFLLFNSSKLVRCSMLLKLQLLLLECFSFRPWHYSQYLLKGQLISE